MQSVITRNGGIVSISLPQRFIIAEAEELKEYCSVLLETEGVTRLIINFAACEFIDSSGLGALVSIYKRCLDRHVGVELSSMSNQHVREIFRLTKLDRIFPIG